MKFFLFHCYTFLTLQFSDRASVIAAIITIRLLVFLILSCPWEHRQPFLGSRTKKCAVRNKLQGLHVA